MMTREIARALLFAPSQANALGVAALICAQKSRGGGGLENLRVLFVRDVVWRGGIRGSVPVYGFGMEEVGDHDIYYLYPKLMVHNAPLYMIMQSL
jgi:hypothetical protein